MLYVTIYNYIYWCALCMYLTCQDCQGKVSVGSCLLFLENYFDHKMYEDAIFLWHSCAHTQYHKDDILLNFTRLKWHAFYLLYKISQIMTFGIGIAATKYDSSDKIWHLRYINPEINMYELHFFFRIYILFLLTSYYVLCYLSMSVWRL